MQRCTVVLAVCDRRIFRGSGRDGFLQADGRGMDEQKQPCMGRFQRCLGACGCACNGSFI